MDLLASEICEAVEGTLLTDAEEAARKRVKGLTWDSRAVEEDMAFLALVGERVDGHDFIVQAVAAGAGLVIATRKPSESQLALAGEFACPVVQVADAQEALNRLASYWRECLRVVVVGVTGSTGKTTTKDMLLSVLSRRYRTVATAANHNNELGVPATILEASRDTEVLVVEMGMRGVGQIEQLCKIVRPNIGLVTNVGTCHLELLGTRENIAHAKGELLASLPATGLAVVNADNDMTDFMLSDSCVAGHGVLSVRFGFAEGADTAISDLTFDAQGCASFTLQVTGRQPFDVQLNIPGRHNVSNAASVACVASYLGVSPESIAQGLAAVKLTGMRMEVSTASNGVRFINDAYNANPDSMKASLATLASMECEGRRTAVLGDMGELGDDEAALHAEVGQAVAKAGIDKLVCVGSLAGNIAAGAAGAGMSEADIHSCADVDEAIQWLRDTLKSDDLVLVKASRFMGMERIVKELQD